jgi:hypothetical protein
MGATTFTTAFQGKTAKHAFGTAVSAALQQYGHGGYSGTIAEKHDFVMIRDTAADVLKKYAGSLQSWTMKDLASEDPTTQARGIANALLDADDDRISDKWGPAGCIHIAGTDRYIFFGSAPS